MSAANFQFTLPGPTTVCATIRYASAQVIGVLCLCGVAAIPGNAGELQENGSGTSPGSDVRLLRYGSGGDGEQVIITHGQGGLAPEDRFGQLARAICKSVPGATVYLVDWTPLSDARISRTPVPWYVARQIDRAAVRAAELLREAGLDPSRTTMIGESFGVYVNARIARRMKGIHQVLAFNPANELAGYFPPDLTSHAKQSWSFHTWSIYDTSRAMAHADFFLETPAGSTHLRRHQSGIPWLTARLQAGDSSWLQMNKSVPHADPGRFSAVATADGGMLLKAVPRVPPSQSGLLAVRADP